MTKLHIEPGLPEAKPSNGTSKLANARHKFNKNTLIALAIETNQLLDEQTTPFSNLVSGKGALGPMAFVLIPPFTSSNP